MFSTYFKLIKKDLFAFIFYIVLIILTVILQNISPILWGELIKNIQSGELDNFLILAGIVIASLLFSTIFQNLAYHVGSKSAVKLSQIGKTQAMEAIYNQSYEYHTSKKSGKFSVLLNKISDMIFGIYFEFFADTFSSIVGVILVTGYLFFTAPKYGISIFIIVLLGVIPFLIAIRINIKARTEADRVKTDYLARVADGLIAFETIKSFGKEKFELKLLGKLLSLLTKNEDRYSVSFRAIDFSSGFGTALIIAVNSILLYLDFKNGVLNISQFVIVMGFSFSFSTKLNHLVYGFRNIFKNTFYFKEVANLLGLKPSKYIPSFTKELPKDIGDIEVNNVDFVYSNGIEAVSNVSLSVPKYSKIALVGESGAGKSTLIKLLLRYYLPKSGVINISGVNILDISEEDLRRLIGIVPQDPVMFNDTILFNVTYGVEKENLSKEELLEIAKKACEKAKLSHFIESLPEKYDSIVGERGIKLSGGQRQRLAIARLFVRDPKVIIFDEATSQLDSESEKAIHTALNELTHEKTTLIIAHRLSTIVHCDRIYVMENGKIIEQGKHKELLELNGRYASLWKIQSEGFFVK